MRKMTSRMATQTIGNTKVGFDNGLFEVRGISLHPRVNVRPSKTHREVHTKKPGETGIDIKCGALNLLLATAAFPSTMSSPGPLHSFFLDLLAWKCRSKLKALAPCPSDAFAE